MQHSNIIIIICLTSSVAKVVYTCTCIALHYFVLHVFNIQPTSPVAYIIKPYGLMQVDDIHVATCSCECLAFGNLVLLAAGWVYKYTMHMLLISICAQLFKYYTLHMQHSSYSALFHRFLSAYSAQFLMYVVLHACTLTTLARYTQA